MKGLYDKDYLWIHAYCRHHFPQCFLSYYVKSRFEADKVEMQGDLVFVEFFDDLPGDKHCVFCTPALSETELALSSGCLRSFLSFGSA